ncbi:MAG: NAD(P)-dependent alcohol dehydrogenase [Okeania sp. SIO2F4]|uniref:NAD(P)-dependent alcohol dehydrogenase n=1 Tax=Okeania sp. SIO2F4 TaxID=2607790 RepID=UPI00142C6216|nr:NAD(P)-dependent alcohol dehydrogenase [Okeania sp. SIO2F4]NES05648.1 NAD(P)-dependent alcohol dehydrogenase [Okeania sp. SIO2F4]
MKAVTISRYGSTEVLEYSEIEKPQITPNQLLVKIQATSVNPVDWKIRQGQIQLLSGFNFPIVLGCDLSGVVLEVGEKVENFEPGDEIYTFINPLVGGAYAEYIAIPANTAALKPKNITHSQAAAIPVAGLTAFQALLDLGQIRPGQKVLINGASGGVGTFAVQIAKAMKTEVIGVCSSKNITLVESLGADRVIDYNQIDFTKESEQYEIIFDAVGKETFSSCENVLKPEGIYISTLPTVENLPSTLITLFMPGKKSKLVLAQPNPRDLISIRELIEDELVKPIIDRTYKLGEIAEAHAYSEMGRAVGKIVISNEETSLVD